VRTRTALVACAAWLVLQAPAFAHGVLRSSSPAHGANLEAPPSEVVLTFSEPVHPQASSAEVLDSQGRVVSRGHEVTPDGRTLRIRVEQLPRGAYTVRWKVVSRVDGHATSGLVSFGVRAAPEASGPLVEGPPWWQVLLRWLGYLSALTLAGTLAFGELILPAAGATKHWVRLRPLLNASATAVAGLAVADLVLRAAWLRPPGYTLVEAARVLATSFGEGSSLLLRLGSAALAAGLGPGWPRGVILVPAATVLLGLTFASHAWGAGPLAALSDWLHLAAASVWVGGLPALALLARLRDPQGTQAIARAFSRWAGYALAVVVATGLYASVLHVPSWQAVVQTDYGRWLALKLALVAVLVLLGAVNRYRVLPGLPSPRALARFASTVRLEVAASALVLLAAGGLAITPPARTVQAASEVRRLTLAAQAGAVRVVLTVQPAEPGWNRFSLALQDARGQPVTVDRALLRVRKLDAESAVPTFRLDPQGPGGYAGESADLGLPGFWELEVVLRRRGEADSVVWFPLRVGDFQLRSDLEAFRLLRRAQEAVERLRTWRETEQTTDGAGNLVVTRYTYQRPDRMAFEIAGGMRGVLVGSDRYLWTGNGWQRDRLPEPFRARGPALYMENPLRAALGRRDPCPEGNCRVVLWESPDGLTTFAAWVGERTARVHKLLMWAPGHVMTSVLEDFDAPVRVAPPR
jgi:copper transport protein